MPAPDPFTGLTDKQAVAVLWGKYHGTSDEELADRFGVDERDIYNLRLGRSHAYSQYERAHTLWLRERLARPVAK